MFKILRSLKWYIQTKFLRPVKSTKRKFIKIKSLSSPKLSCYQQCKRTGEELAQFQFLIFNGHANVIRHLNWLVNNHVVISYCLKAVNLFKRLCQMVNVCVVRFHIYSKKFSSWFTVSGVEWEWFFCVFYHPMTSVISKFQNYVPS